MIPLELAVGFGIGLSLGLLGGGGSLLTVPALVYLVGQTPQAALTTSLAIVGTNSLIGRVHPPRTGNDELESCVPVWWRRDAGILFIGERFKSMGS